MDYYVGGVAALLTGNTTPNRPTVVKKALTPKKYQKSPNVTPKSELVADRSVFLSPSVQKKKEIVKKSPKRIFESLEGDDGSDKEGNNSLKTDKAKKHLQDDLNSSSESKSGKKGSKSKTNQVEISPSKSTPNNTSNNHDTTLENTPKKKKRKHENSIAKPESIQTEEEQPSESSKKKSKKNKGVMNTGEAELAQEITEVSAENKPKKTKKKKNKAKKQSNTEDLPKVTEEEQNNIPENAEEPELQVPPETTTKKKKNKNKKKNKKSKTTASQNEVKEESKENKINKNAITEQDTDSEHDSDNEIDSETENKDILDTGEASASSDEEADQKPPEKTPKVKPEKTKPSKSKPVTDESEESIVKRTLFVGNVPFSKKCKKDIKKIFGKYGDIETVRIRTIPVKDGRVTPKMAVIKNELHPDRTTVNVYVKFHHEASVDKALTENNTVYNTNHLRVTRSSETGCPDASLSIFVGNVPFGIEDDILRAVFDKCGDVDSVRVVRDKQTNAGKGFGYVNFKSKDSVELALQMSEEDLTIKNRILRVKRCNYSTKQKQNTQSHRREGDRNTPNKFAPKQNRFRQESSQNRFRQESNQNRFRQESNQNRFRQESNQNRFRQEPNQNRFGQDKREGNKFDKDGKSGAYRRIQKRRNQETDKDGPPSKKPFNDINQPSKEKKPRKEFVGVTADKKKKRKFDKGQKKKKVLSEILTKH